MAHGQWTEVEARSVLGAWKKSGLGLEAFARSRGLVPQRLYWWKKKLPFGAAVEKGEPLALLPVRVRNTPSGAHVEPRRARYASYASSSFGGATHGPCSLELE